MQPRNKTGFICHTFKRNDYVLKSFLKNFNFKRRLSDRDKIGLFDKMLLWAEKCINLILNNMKTLFFSMKKYFFK